MGSPIVELAKIVLDPEYEFSRTPGSLQRGIPVLGCLLQLRTLDLGLDDECDSGFGLANIAPLLLLPSLNDLRLRNCLDLFA